jgi:hypothetical protein
MQYIYLFYRFENRNLREAQVFYGGRGAETQRNCDGELLG